MSMLREISDRMRGELDAAEIERLRGLLTIARAGLEMAVAKIEGADWHGAHHAAQGALRSSEPDAATALCGHTFLSGPCIRPAGHEPPHRDAHGCEWQGVTSLDLAPQREAPNAD